MLNQYATYCRAAGMRPGTVRLRLMWLKRAARHFDLTTATTGDLLAWLSSEEWAPETRKSARNSLRSFYAWAVDFDVLPRNPALKLPAVKVPVTIPRPAPTDRLQTALTKATDRDALVLSLAAFAGLRRSEIAGLRWDSVTWAGLRVNGKGGRTRQVPLLPQLATLLDLERARRERGEFGTGYRFAVDPFSPYVFPGRLVEHISPYTIGEILSAALGDGWTGHTLRHRFATLAYSVDRDLLTVQQLLGHSKPETTARYTAVPHGAAAAAVAGTAA